MSKAKVGVMVGAKGRGSNLAALVSACQKEEFPAEIVLVVAESAHSPALQRARELKLQTQVVSSEKNFGNQLVEAFRKVGCEWICLAGFLRLLPKEMLEAFPRRILNIHPALLPKFGGKGMYGMRVHEAVLAAREKESGCTVHFVNEHYDQGEILFQLHCHVEPGDTPETLASRVLALEHQAYPQALQEAIRRNA